MIKIKSQKEIAIMRSGGKIAERILNELEKKAKAGVSTKELERAADTLFTKYHTKASFKGFRGYPASICTSINDEIVHGIPAAKILKNGDILGLDIGVYHHGFHTDMARTIPIGKIDKKAKKLIKITKLALDKAIEAIKPGLHLGDIQNIIQETIQKAGFSVIKDLTGHGIGRNLQEDPAIANYGQKGQGIILKEGMTLAIEPMATAGSWKIKVLADGWTVVSFDHSLSAHFEHTLAITKTGCSILTKT